MVSGGRFFGKDASIRRRAESNIPEAMRMRSAPDLAKSMVRNCRSMAAGVSVTGGGSRGPQ